MDASRIQARAVFKIVAVALVALGIAMLLEHVVVEVRTTIRWLFASIFVALALSPLVDLIGRLRVRGSQIPRWLAILASYVLFFAAFAFLVLNVAPPIVREAEELGSELPTYVSDFEDWAENSDDFRSLNDKYGITHLLNEEAQSLPSHLGDAASELKAVTVGLLNNLVEATVVLTLAFFLLLDGAAQFHRLTRHLTEPARGRVRRLGGRIAQIVRSYVSVNLLLAVLAGLFTFAALELLGVDLALPLAVLVGILDLVPLVGFTVGGILVAIVAAFHDFPTALIVWAVLFLVYQQVQDRVIQPVFYRSAVRVHPAVAIVAVLAGAQLAGILGALLAIPVAASIGAILDEFWPLRQDEDDADPDAAGADDSGAEPSTAPAS